MRSFTRKRVSFEKLRNVRRISSFCGTGSSRSDDRTSISRAAKSNISWSASRHASVPKIKLSCSTATKCLLIRKNKRTVRAAGGVVEIIVRSIPLFVTVSPDCCINDRARVTPIICSAGAASSSYSRKLHITVAESVSILKSWSACVACRISSAMSASVRIALPMKSIKDSSSTMFSLYRSNSNGRSGIRRPGKWCLMTAIFPTATLNDPLSKRSPQADARDWVPSANTSLPAAVPIDRSLQIRTDHTALFPA